MKPGGLIEQAVLEAQGGCLSCGGQLIHTTGRKPIRCKKKECWDEYRLLWRIDTYGVRPLETVVNSYQISDGWMDVLDCGHEKFRGYKGRMIKRACRECRS